MTAAAFVIAGLGVVLIWSGGVGDDPRQVFSDTFRGTRAGRATDAKAKQTAKDLQGDAGGLGTYPARTGRTR
jgi:hypothetical protein